MARLNRPSDTYMMDLMQTSPAVPPHRLVDESHGIRRNDCERVSFMSLSKLIGMPKEIPEEMQVLQTADSPAYKFVLTHCPNRGHGIISVAHLDLRFLLSLSGR
jgi:hypothetical protein